MTALTALARTLAVTAAATAMVLAAAPAAAVAAAAAADPAAPAGPDPAAPDAAPAAPVPAVPVPLPGPLMPGGGGFGLPGFGADEPPPPPATDSWFGGEGLPTEGFDVGYAPPGWNDFTGKVGGVVLEGAFSLSKLTASGTVAVLQWAFDGASADVVASIVDPTATRFHVSLFGTDTGLYDVVLLIAVALACLRAVRGRFQEAAGELLMTWLIAALYFAVFVLSPGGFSGAVDGMRSFAANLSGVLVEATLGESPGCATPDVAGPGDAVMCPLRDAFHTAFVVGTYDQLNWGRDLGATGGCAAARDQLVASGPHGTADEPRTVMESAGCADEAAYQAVVTADRVLLALVVVGVQSILLLVVMVIGLSLTMLQMGMAISMLLLPFVVLVSLVPGAMRGVLWRWVSWNAKLVAGVVAAAVVLAIYLVIITETLAVTAGAAMGLRIVSLIVPTLGLLWARRRAAKAAKAVGGQTGAVLDRATPGRPAGGMVNQAASAFSAPQYRGVAPNAYANPTARAAARDAVAVARALRSRRVRRGAT